MDKKAFNKTDILMRNDNPSPSEDYFLCEKKKISQSSQSPHLSTSFNMIRNIFNTLKKLKLLEKSSSNNQLFTTRSGFAAPSGAWQVQMSIAFLPSEYHALSNAM